MELGPKSTAKCRHSGLVFSGLCQILLLFEILNLSCSQTCSDTLLITCYTIPLLKTCIFTELICRKKSELKISSKRLNRNSGEEKEKKKK